MGGRSGGGSTDTCWLGVGYELGVMLNEAGSSALTPRRLCYRMGDAELELGYSRVWIEFRFVHFSVPRRRRGEEAPCPCSPRETNVYEPKGLSVTV